MKLLETLDKINLFFAIAVHLMVIGIIFYPKPVAFTRLPFKKKLLLMIPFINARAMITEEDYTSLKKIILFDNIVIVLVLLYWILVLLQNLIITSEWFKNYLLNS